MAFLRGGVEPHLVLGVGQLYRDPAGLAGRDGKAAAGGLAAALVSGGVGVVTGGQQVVVGVVAVLVLLAGHGLAVLVQHLQGGIVGGLAGGQGHGKGHLGRVVLGCRGVDGAAQAKQQGQQAAKAAGDVFFIFLLLLRHKKAVPIWAARIVWVRKRALE